MLRWTPKPDHENAHEEVYTVHKCLLQEGRKSLACYRITLRLLQLLQGSQDPQSDPRHGGWINQEAVDHWGVGWINRCKRLEFRQKCLFLRRKTKRLTLFRHIPLCIRRVSETNQPPKKKSSAMSAAFFVDPRIGPVKRVSNWDTTIYLVVLGNDIPVGH